MRYWFGLTFFVFLLDSPVFAQEDSPSEVDIEDDEEEDDEDEDEDDDEDDDEDEGEGDETEQDEEPPAVESVSTPPAGPVSPSDDEVSEGGDLTKSEVQPQESSEVESQIMDEQDIQYRQESLNRYRLRLEEFFGIAKKIVEEREEQEKTRLSRQYDERIKNLKEEKSRAQKDARAEMEYFVENYPQSPESAELMVQLGNMYFDEDREIVKQKLDEAFEAGEDLELMVDHARSIELYRRVVHSFPETSTADIAAYMLGYIYSDEQSLPASQEESKKYFQFIVDNYPTSANVNKATLQLGKFYLGKAVQARGEENRELRASLFAKAEDYFQRTYENSSPPELEWEEGLYFLTQVKYTQGSDNFDVLKESLALQTKMLDYAENKVLNYGGNPFSFETQTLKLSTFTIVFLFKEMGMEGNLAPYIESIYGEKVFETKYVRSIFEGIAEQEEGYGNIVSAIKLRERMIELWPDHPDNPRVHQLIATTYEEKLLQTEKANETRSQFVNLYGPNTSWWNVNNKNPKAQDVALSILDEMMRQVAVDLNSAAAESEDQAMRTKAIETYQKYLVQFPFSDHYYNMQWELSVALVQNGEFLEAIKELKQLQKSTENHPYGGLASIQIFASYQELINKTLEGDFKNRPEDATVERTIQVPPSEDYPEGEMNIYELSPLMQLYIGQYNGLDSVNFEKERKSITDFIAKQKEEADAEKDPFLKKDIEGRIAYWEEPETGVLDTLAGFEEYVKERKKDGIFSIAYLYFSHNRFEEARSWFSKIITEDRFSAEAKDAARNIIRTYQDVGDWKSIQDTANRYLANMIAPGEENSDFAKELRQYGAEANWQIAQTVLKTAEQLGQAQRREESSAAFADAAQRFESFFIEFPKSENRAEALRLAAACFGKAGQTERSADLFKEFIRLFPKNENAPIYMSQIAESYMSILEFDKSLKYYEILYKRTKNDPKHKELKQAALQNKPVLKVGIGDYVGAAKGYEEYAKTLKGKEKEKAFYQAKHYWELSETSWSKLEYYKRYRKQFGLQNPGHAMEIQNSLIDFKRIYYAKEVKLETDNLEKLYDQFLAKKVADPLVHKYGAPTKLRKMDERLEKIKDLKFVDPNKKGGFKKNFTEIIPASKALLDSDLLPYCQNFIEMVKIDNVYRDMDTLVASLYCEGKAVLDVLAFRNQFEFPEFVDNLEETLERDDLSSAQRAQLEAKVDEIEKIRSGLSRTNEELQAYALKQLNAGLELSKRENFWSTWHTKIKGLLHTMDSEKYPPDADEVLFFEGTSVLDPLLPFSPVGGLYSTKTELPVSKEDSAQEESPDSPQGPEDTKDSSLDDESPVQDNNDEEDSEEGEDSEESDDLDENDGSEEDAEEDSEEEDDEEDSEEDDEEDSEEDDEEDSEEEGEE